MKPVALYQEKLRPQVHFSSKSGSLNDPNGLVFYNGEYHLFYQLSPNPAKWGNLHWGHAVSADLVNWRELEVALFPDELGEIFSGSAVVDWKNTSGLGEDGTPPLVCLYTAAGKIGTQCLAYSLDGRKFVKYPRNPVIGMVTVGARDPKVIWDAARGRWVMVLYVADDQAASNPDKPMIRHGIQFFSSKDLITWTKENVYYGGIDDDHFLYECPDFFPLKAAGGEEESWILIGANAEYQIGSFDGTTFTAKTPRLCGTIGKIYYAAQTFNDEPVDRRVAIGWLRSPSPDMPFNHCMSVSLELSLMQTDEGARLSYWPVKELETLRHDGFHVESSDLKEGDAAIVHELQDTFDCEIRFRRASLCLLKIGVRDAVVEFDSVARTISFNGQSIVIPRVPTDSHSMRLIGDRTTLEMFFDGGVVYWPVVSSADAAGSRLNIEVSSGTAQALEMSVYKLSGIWPGLQHGEHPDSFKLSSP